jgi:hypothetical protein
VNILYLGNYYAEYVPRGREFFHKMAHLPSARIYNFLTQRSFGSRPKEANSALFNYEWFKSCWRPTDRRVVCLVGVYRLPVYARRSNTGNLLGVMEAPHVDVTVLYTIQYVCHEALLVQA